tara:strand:- start:2931 stop:3827 length:897 start_codon:yes stop_codon:yes gene_type:complete
MLKNIIFSGCSTKGILYIGIFKALEELNIRDEIINYCGVSSGSIAALMGILDFNYKQLEKIIYNISLDNLMNLKNNVHIFSIVEKCGILDGNKIQRLIEIILEKKFNNKHITFNELKMYIPDKNLIVIGTNLTSNSMGIFSYDTTPDMKISTAIRISTAFPLIFKPIKYKGKFYSDGGIINNFPIDLFEHDLDNTIGISIKIDTISISDTLSIDRYLMKLFELMTTQKEEYLKHKYFKHTINIDLSNQTENTFDFSNTYKKKLILLGYEHFMEKYRKTDLYINSIIKDIVYDIINNIV